MPYNGGDKEASWKLLSKHCARGCDPWVAKADAQDVSENVEAILCVAVEDYPSSDIQPEFQSCLRHREVLVLLKNSHRHSVPFAVEMIISGGKHGWNLKFDGRPFEIMYDEELPPSSSRWFKRTGGLFPLIVWLQPPLRAYLDPAGYLK